MQEREQGFIFLPQMKGDISFQKKSRGKVHGLLGDCIFIYSILRRNEGRSGEENCESVAQEPELATRKVIWWFARRQ